MTEILSPCGSSEAVTAAVRCGADAVYLGVANFNARRSAKNFSLEEFGKTAEYCRINGVKVYIALNTLISDSEMPEVIDTAKRLALLGADAFIVQDLGLAKQLRYVLPKIPLHASTQTVIHSHKGLEALKSLGFTRVVAAREMDKHSLKKLCDRAKELGMEVEVFVHGALCMCLSGACLMSSQIGGRSGNRGMCAQPCRLPFSVEGGNGYDLSLKDLSLIDKLTELADMGVTSFKIEGRMKRAEYVAAATAAARASLDFGYVPQEIQQMLGSVFSRSGFTDGYFEGKTGADMFGRRSDEDKLNSAAVLKGIHDLYRTERQKIGLDMKFTALSNSQMTLKVTDGENSVTVTADAAEPALNKATAEIFIKSKLEKLGGSCYFAKSIACIIDDGLAVSGAVLGEMRRNAVTLLNKKRGEAEATEICDLPKSDKLSAPHRKCELIARFRTAAQIPDDLGGVSAVILPLECDFEKLNLTLPIYAELPRVILGSEEKVLERLISVKPYIKGAVCSNLCTLELCKNADVPFAADIFMNIYNSETAEVIKELGAEWYSVSAECSVEAIRAMPPSKAFFAYGRLPLMIARNCPGKNGKGCKECSGVSQGRDRLGNSFPIACRNGFSEIYNFLPHSLSDRIDEFGCDKAILYFTFEDKNEIGEILSHTKNRSKPKGEYTRGLYYRTIL